MNIVTLINYNPITGSLAGYGMIKVRETITPLSKNNTLRRYQQTINTKRKMVAYQRTQHK